jgi:Family of unknown function (DUF6476)
VDQVSSVLKSFVIASGIVLVAGTILLVVLIMLRAGSDDAPVLARPPQSLSLPAGARIEQVVVDGRRLVLLGVDGAGAQFLAVVDPMTGERLSLLRVQPE